MSANSRLTVAVHVLTWMVLDRQGGNEVATSERIASSVNTNPVVIRRCLGDLRKAGLVEARRGTGAGWLVTREPETVTLLDVYEALDEGGVFGMHNSEPNQSCPVGFGIRPTLRHVYDGVEDTMRKQLAGTTIADVLRDVLAQERAKGQAE
ncbi:MULTISPECIES: Rrf2 family transcriptional regulator [Streptomyces]|uniref:Rrf2 family transcriptional regulator n=1 Tax=Streptomyces kaempferi TaxID=333725 RepID=A0ABW3XRQ0_9ACTN|nr:MULTISPECIES: Rrf2 family transcriptional regulator [unclassified Streptomyces]QIY60815.1 Rrf2 family transcriptional regulator [Streptomyces sp. RPA4-2]